MLFYGIIGFTIGALTYYAFNRMKVFKELQKRLEIVNKCLKVSAADETMDEMELRQYMLDIAKYADVDDNFK